MTSNQNVVRLDIEDAIATVLLNRPEVLNAFSRQAVAKQS